MLIIFPIQIITEPRRFIQSQFATTVDLANCLSDIFCHPAFAIKTQTGAMKCHLTACFGEDDIFFSIISNRSIFFCSDKKDGKTTFSCTDNNLEDVVNNLRNYSNDLSNVATKALGGFTTKTNFRHFHLPANTRLLNYSCRTEVIASHMKKNASSYETIANQSNAILPSSESLNQFRAVVKLALRDNGNENIRAEPYHDIAKAALAKCFVSPQQIKRIPIQETQRHALCKDLVMWGHTNVEAPLSLETVIQQLHTTRASLTQGCKETLGIGPMTILRYIRLEHIYKALAKSEISKESNLQNVEQIRGHYGFVSRGNFAALYKNYFDERPKETKLKSRY